MKQYVGLVRDHSGSMRSVWRAALADYNNTIEDLRLASQRENIDTIMNVVAFWSAGKIEREVVNSSLAAIKPLTRYDATGSSTPLFDAVEDLINLLKAAPDNNQPGVSFLVMVTTDGQDNASRSSSYAAGARLAGIIRGLQATDRWTFTFRVPYGGKHTLTRLGIPTGNIQEWEAGNERDFERSSVVTRSAVSNYYSGRTRGLTASTSFYADMSDLSERKVAQTMAPTNKVKFYPVKNRDDISTFMQRTTGRPYSTGSAFYQLSKTEKAVQPHKNIIVRNQSTGHVYEGHSARQLLGLPDRKTISLKPGNHGEWDIFIQSTSSNRVILPGTEVAYFTGN